MTALESLLWDAREQSACAARAESTAAQAYQRLDEAVAGPLRDLALFLIWAATPAAGERWECEHGHVYMIETVDRNADGTACVKPDGIWDDPCRCPRTVWHTSAFLPAWRPE